MTCQHCNVEITRNSPTSDFYQHVTHLNRCQDSGLMYGYEAHPAGSSCPPWCLGYKE